MTASMIVTNLVNMQSFAATVDKQLFDSGDKVLHNVVGNLGVVLSDGGDLRPDIPMQSVHDGVSYRHEPWRLLVHRGASFGDEPGHLQAYRGP